VLLAAALAATSRLAGAVGAWPAKQKAGQGI